MWLAGDSRIGKRNVDSGNEVLAAWANRYILSIFQFGVTIAKLAGDSMHLRLLIFRRKFIHSGKFLLVKSVVFNSVRVEAVLRIDVFQNGCGFLLYLIRVVWKQTGS